MSKVRPTIAKERYFTTTHNYFFEVKIASNGSQYIVIDQRRKNDKGEWVGTKMRIFEDELLEFKRVFSKMIDVVHNYLPKQLTQNNSINTTSVQSPFPSPVLTELLSTGDWKIFEENTYILIKMLGIQNAYKFSNDNQAGKADGFFRFNNLAVMYDCTIKNQQIEDRKSEQIYNYCNRLKSGRLEFSGNIVEEFSHCNKQVWIISKGESRKVGSVNNIPVKIIGINHLVSLYEQRLLKPMNSLEFEMALTKI